ncbi:MAG: hypothetical protein WEA81_05690, partial [Dehalococcoidia bacterium]
MTPRKSSIGAYVAVLALVAFVVVVLPATGTISVPSLPVAASDIREARVEAVLVDEPAAASQSGARRQLLLVDVDGERAEVEHYSVAGSAQGFSVSPGDRILVALVDAGNGQQRYLVQDQVRRAPIWMLSLAFALLVVL